MVKRLLEYTQQENSDLVYGLLLVLGLLTTELIRSWSLALTWALNYRTGSRLRGAILSLAFDKILKLRSVRDKSMGQVGFIFVCLFVCLIFCLFLFCCLPFFLFSFCLVIFDSLPSPVCLHLSVSTCLSLSW